MADDTTSFLAEETTSAPTQHTNPPVAHSPSIPITSLTQPNLISLNATAQLPIKLTSTNYPSWLVQFETLLIGYDLLGYIDGSTPCPPLLLTLDGKTISNPQHAFWTRQDKLLLH